MLQGCPRVKLTCEVCDDGFTAHGQRAKTARFCSRRCKGIASRIPERPCDHCGENYKPPMGRRDTSRLCSRACSGASRKARYRLECGRCGAPFHVPAARKGVARFCSKPCADEWSGRNKVEYQCKTCGAAFRWSPSRDTANNVTYCSLPCRDADPERRAMLLRMNAEQQRKAPNRLERAGYAILDGLGVDYEPQVTIGGKFIVDALVGGSLVVQFDGEYWHGHPVKFPKPDHRQQKRMRLDKSQDAYMAACGLRVLRLWESEVHRQPTACAERIRSALRGLRPPSIRRGSARPSPAERSL